MKTIDNVRLTIYNCVRGRSPDMVRFIQDEALGAIWYEEYVTRIFHRYDIGQMLIRSANNYSEEYDYDQINVEVDLDLKMFEWQNHEDHEKIVIEYDADDDFLRVIFKRYKLLP